jgi:hypothetical protein
MRLAGSPEVYDVLSRRFADGGVPGEASRHLAAEVMVDGGQIDTRLDTFFRMYELLQSKGYSEPAAQHLAVEMMEGREPMARMTRRYAAINGQQFPDAGGGSPAD